MPRDRRVSKKWVSASHQDSARDRNASSRSAEAEAYRFTNSSLVSLSGSVGTPTSMASIVRNQRSSLTH